MDVQISIIIPVYNTKQYLTTCIDSVRKQTYQNLEIILVDDGSNDGSSEMCDDFAKEDERIRVIHQINSGLSAARNAGITLSTGKYVAFVDSDDYIHPQMIQRLYSALIAYDADIACCDYQRVSDCFGKTEIALAENVQSNEKVYLGNELFDKLYSSEYAMHIVCWNKLYKRELVTEIPFPVNRIHEDEYFTPRVLQRIKKAVWLEERLYYYVIREGSLSKSGLEKSCRHKLSCMRENAQYFFSICENHAYEMESVRYLKGIVYFSRQFRKRKPTNKELMRELRCEFREYYKKYSGSAIRKMDCLNFWCYEHFYYIHMILLDVLNSLRQRIRKG